MFGCCIYIFEGIYVAGIWFVITDNGGGGQFCNCSNEPTMNVITSNML